RALRTVEELAHGLGHRFGLVARDQHTGLERVDRFRCAARPSGDHGPAARLRFEEHDAETFEVPSNLAVGKREDVALLVALDEPIVVRDAEELNDIGDALFARHLFELRVLPALT